MSRPPKVLKEAAINLNLNTLENEAKYQGGTQRKGIYKRYENQKHQTIPKF